MPPRLNILCASRVLTRTSHSCIHTSASRLIAPAAALYSTASRHHYRSLSQAPLQPSALQWRQPQLQHQQRRSASILNALADNPGALHKRIRRGRGPASGKGKTSGRGHKGQKQHGKVPAGFNGGQTKEIITKGKRGFVNNFTEELVPINLDRIQSWIDQGRLDPSEPITLKELQESRCIHRCKDGVKLLARNASELRSSFHIIVSRASASAIAAVEAVGGTVTTRYYTRSSIRNILLGLTHPTVSLAADPSSIPDAATLYAAPFLTSSPTTSSASATGEQQQQQQPTEPATVPAWKAYPYRLPDPVSRKHLEYYRDEAHRGYLRHTVKPGEGPSLFFRKELAPGEKAPKKKMTKEERLREKEKRERSREKAANRIF